MDSLRIPSIEEVDSIIEKARVRNDGPWINHSYNVGIAARCIASYVEGMDEDVAYALGCLHDIGRHEGFSHMHHVISGYNLMMEKGYCDVARICLTHSFPMNDIRCYSGKNDCSDEEYNFLRDFLNEVEYTEYDRLIQLCDAIALAEGFCLIEKRLVDVTLRHGFNDMTISKWKAFLSIEEEFGSKIGASIYSVLPKDRAIRTKF